MVSDQAMGFVETRGQAALVRTADAMHKAGRVEWLDYVKIGSAYVTILVYGETGAVQTAVAAGAAALEGREGLVGHNTLPAPHREILNRFLHGEYRGEGEFGSALGVLEAKGLAGLISAHDAALKEGQTTTLGFFAVGSGMVSVLLKGDVAAVEAALEAGKRAGGRVSQVHSTLSIPYPHRDLAAAFLDERPRDPQAPRRAVAVLETRGFAGAFAGADAGLKAADVSLECWKKIGGGLVSATWGGDVAAAQAALHAAAAAAKPYSDSIRTVLIPRPHASVFSKM